MVDYQDTLNLLSKAVGSLFNKDISFFDTNDLDQTVAFIDDCIKKIKEYQTLTMMKSMNSNKKLTAFYTLISAESNGIKYTIEIGSILNNSSFQYIISVKDPNVVIIRRKLLNRGSICYRTDFNTRNEPVCFTRVHRLDEKRNYL